MSRPTRFERELPRVVRPRPRTELIEEGVTAYALRGPGWTQTSYGLYVPAQVAGSTPAQRIYEAAAAVPRRAVLTGWAALYPSGVAHLDGVDPVTGELLPVLVNWAATGGDGTPDHIKVVRQWVEGDEVVVRHGLRLAVPLRAALDDMTCQSELWRAVATADAAAHASALDLARLTDVAETTKGRRGIAMARLAAALADAAARSPWESRLRVFYVVDLGLPRPEVNIPIFEKGTERLVGMADLLDVEAGHVTEFDGQHHRRRRQHNKDNVREEDFEELNLVVTRADSIDLNEDRPGLARRLEAGRTRGLARDRAKDRWTIEEPEWWLAQMGGAGVVLTDELKAELYGDA